MKKTQKNKSTEGHLGLLKAKLAKLRAQLIEEESKSSGGGGGEGFDVARSGDGRVAMVGFPSVGKSTLLSKLTGTKSEAAAYEFTTLTCIPGKIEYAGATVQLLDLPGIIQGAAKGRGRGKEVISVARSSDMVLMVLDAPRAEIQKEQLTKELEEVGIRLNKEPADITLVPKKVGGIKMASTCELTHLNEKLVRQILHFYKIHNAELVIREDATADDFIDIVVGNRKYLKCLYLVNKVDTVMLDEVDRLARMPYTVVASAFMGLNMDGLLKGIWDTLDFIRVYTKPRGSRPEFTEPLILRRGSTVHHVCHSIHRDFAARFKYAMVWGKSAKHQPQRVGLAHELEDEDVIQLMASSGGSTGGGAAARIAKSSRRAKVKSVRKVGRFGKKKG